MNTPTLFDLSDNKKVLTLSGADAAVFLQGQTSCDVLSLNETNSLFGALCNPKGRAISLFHLFKREETYYMVLPSDLFVAIIKRLKMFVFRSDVQVNDVSDSFNVLGINEPLDDSAQLLLKPLAYIKQGFIDNLALLVVSTDYYSILNSDHSLASINVQYDDWQALLIQACIPEITADMSELFIPQMLNLDALGGINFQKGCYTGQEVIARMHYKGTVKRRLVAFNSNHPYSCADSIYAIDDTNSIGTVVHCIPSSNDQYIGLIVLKTSFINSTEIVLENSQKLTVRLPKYKLD